MPEPVQQRVRLRLVVRAVDRVGARRRAPAPGSRRGARRGPRGRTTTAAGRRRRPRARRSRGSRPAKPGSEPAGTRWKASQRCRPIERSDMSVPTRRTSRSPFSRSAAEQRRGAGRARGGDEDGRLTRAIVRSFGAVSLEPGAPRRISSPLPRVPHLAPARQRARPAVAPVDLVAASVARATTSTKLVRSVARARSRRRGAAALAARDRRGPSAPPARRRERRPVVRRRGDVVERGRRRGQVPVDQRDRDAVAEDDVRREEVVVADRRRPGRARARAARVPAGGRTRPARRASAAGARRAPRAARRRRRLERRLALDEREDLASRSSTPRTAARRRSRPARSAEERVTASVWAGGRRTVSPTRTTTSTLTSPPTSGSRPLT